MRNDFPMIEIDAQTVSQDATRFLDNELRRRKITSLYNEGMVSVLKKNIEEGAQGMFSYISEQLHDFIEQFHNGRLRNLSRIFAELLQQNPGRFNEYYGE